LPNHEGLTENTSAPVQELREERGCCFYYMRLPPLKYAETLQSRMRRRRLGCAGGKAMKYSGWIMAIMIAVASTTLGHAQSNLTEQSLKTTHETMVSTIKTANLVMLQAMIHPRALGFFRESQATVQIRDNYTVADALPSVIAEFSRFMPFVTDTVYRVVGQVGIVCMTTVLQPKAGEKQPTRYLRGTYIYISEGGKWTLVSWHGSDTVLAKK
jgi:hypothetical protein